MASIVTITAVPDTLTCRPDGSGEILFNVSNTTGRPLRIGAKVLVKEPLQEGWLRIDGDAGRELAEQATDQITVRVQVPPDTPSGKYVCRLLVYSEDRPGEDFTEGEAVSLLIPARKEPKPTPLQPDERRFRWWIPAAAVLLLVGILAVVFWPEKEPELAEVPTLQGQRLAAGIVALDSRELQLGGVTERDESNKPEGTILEQNPAAKERVPKGTKVALVVAKRPGGRIVFTPVEIQTLKSRQLDKKFQITPQLLQAVPVQPK